MEWSFTVPGRPVTWQRSGVHEGKRLTQKEQREAKKNIAWAATMQRPKGRWPMDVVYAIEVIGYWPDRRFGDVDRLVSIVMDALQGVAYKEDRQVRVQTSSMLLDRENPRTEVLVVPYRENFARPVVSIDLQRLPSEDASG